MKTENEVRTITTIRLDAEDKKILDEALDILFYINREMCGMHAIEGRIVNVLNSELDEPLSELDEPLEAEQLAGFIQTLREMRNCLGIQIEGDYYEGMS